nr:C-type lectin domain family 17, member A-like [Penaeus vannamei]
MHIYGRICVCRVTFNASLLPQSLTDLLLRQESQLRESAGILKEILSETKGSLATEASCSGTFRKFGGTCLYLAKDVKKTWDAARTFCQDLGGDLAVFRDANALAEAIGYAKALGIHRNNNVWVGGTDRTAEGKWEWVSGEDMPRGTPFWGIYNNVRQPNTGRGENCALLHGKDDFMMHDAPCGWTGIPLCQTKPT